MPIGKLSYNNIVKYLMIWCIVQDFALSILYKLVKSPILINPVFYSKDILLIILFVWATTRTFGKGQIIVISYLYYIIVFVAVQISLFNQVDTLAGIIQNIRNVVLFPCFFTIGYAINKREDFLAFCTGKYIKWIVLSTMFGLTDYFLDKFVGTAQWWRTGIGFTRYYTEIKHQGNKMLFGLPGNFYGSYGKGFFAVKRLVGFWGNPLTCAYSLLFPALFIFFELMICKKHTKKCFNNLVMFCVLMGGIFFSHTRAILFLIVILIVGYIFLNMNKKPGLFILTMFAFLVALFLVDYSTIIKFIYDGSTAGHIEEVSNFLKDIRISLFGHGISYAGTATATGVGTESAYLTLIGNTGVFGCLIYLQMLLTVLNRLLKNFHHFLPFGKAITFSMIALLITGMLSEQLFAYTTVAPFYIMLGFTFSNCVMLRSPIRCR